jgi:hypothetical protein
MLPRQPRSESGHFLERAWVVWIYWRLAPTKACRSADRTDVRDLGWVGFSWYCSRSDARKLPPFHARRLHAGSLTGGTIEKCRARGQEGYISGSLGLGRKIGISGDPSSPLASSAGQPVARLTVLSLLHTPGPFVRLLVSSGLIRVILHVKTCSTTRKPTATERHFLARTALFVLVSLA